MKANEFVKKFGLNEAKKIIGMSKKHGKQGLFYSLHDKLYYGSPMLDRVSVDDLKRLVASHELVEKHGGLDEAKIYVPDGYKSERLKQAIADVESCQ